MRGGAKVESTFNQQLDKNSRQNVQLTCQSIVNDGWFKTLGFSLTLDQDNNCQLFNPKTNEMKNIKKQCDKNNACYGWVIGKFDGTKCVCTGDAYIVSN